MNDDGLDPAFRARLREVLGRAVREDRPRTIPAGPRLALGLLAVTGLVVALGSTGMTTLPPHGSPSTSAAEARIGATCASEQVHVSPAAETRIGDVSSHLGVSVMVATTGSEAPAAEILAACAALWRDGALVPLGRSVEFQSRADGVAIAPESSGPQSSEGVGGDGALSASRTDDHPVPPLVICALPGGAPMVVPHLGCGDVGLRDWPVEDAR